MDIRFLESFVMVADSGSITKAAHRLNVTPAALAQRLRTLEQDLGHALVTRVGRTVRPTTAGLAVLGQARRVIEGVNDLRALVVGDEPAGRLQLGATATSLTGLLPDILARLRESYPRIECFVSPDSSFNLYHWVLSGDLDAALIVRPQFAIPKTTEWLTLRREPLVLIAPENQDLSDPFAVISKYPFIRYDRNQWGGHTVERFMRKHNLRVQEWLELDALDAIAGLVNRGLGVAVVPDWAPPWPAGLRLSKAVLPGGGHRDVGLIWNRSGPRIAAIRAFAEVCRTSVPLPDPEQAGGRRANAGKSRPVRR